MEGGVIKINLKWSGKEYNVELTENDTVLDLKSEIEKQTGVKPERQKLLNLKLKGNLYYIFKFRVDLKIYFLGKTPEDDCKLGQLKLKANFKLMMMGSLEEDILEAASTPTNLPDVVNDLDIEEEEVAIENQEVYLAKIEKRIKEYKINILNELRPGKNLLVLDIDYTLFDHRSTAQTGAELMRPYLHEFLTQSYKYYDIVIWSATGMKWIEEKMKLLGVSTNSNYKIAFYLDSSAMISVHTPKYGLLDVRKKTKF